jgi:hypothetical protein
MATTTLVEPKVRDAQRLLRLLDEEGLPTFAAFWYLDPETEIWRLVLGTELVDTVGSTTLYRRLRDLLAATADISISVDDILLVGRGDPRLAVIEGAPPERYFAVPLHLFHTVSGRSYVHDAYILRTG